MYIHTAFIIAQSIKLVIVLYCDTWGCFVQEFKLSLSFKHWEVIYNTWLLYLHVVLKFSHNVIVIRTCTCSYTYYVIVIPTCGFKMFTTSFSSSPSCIYMYIQECSLTQLCRHVKTYGGRESLGKTRLELSAKFQLYCPIQKVHSGSYAVIYSTCMWLIERTNWRPLKVMVSSLSALISDSIKQG